jgi:hypothetical protein
MLNLMSREATASPEKVNLLLNVSGNLFLLNLLYILHVLKISYRLLSLTNSITVIALSAELCRPKSL